MSLDSMEMPMLSEAIYFVVISVYVITHRLCEPTLPH